MIDMPFFKDGEVLSEKELYQLSWLPFSLLQPILKALHLYGFIATTENCNHFELQDDVLLVSDLAVISPEGIPFFISGEQKIDLEAGETELFATVMIAESSGKVDEIEEVDDDFDEDDEEFDEDEEESMDIDDEADDLDSAEVGYRQGYHLVFHWSEDSVPYSEGVRSFSIKLADIDKKQGLQLIPTAFSKIAVPKLRQVCDTFVPVLAKLKEDLYNPEKTTTLERDALLENLEQLLHSFDSNQPLAQHLFRTKDFLESLKGFLLRLLYLQGSLEQGHQVSKGLKGTLLEHQLDVFYRDGKLSLSNEGLKIWLEQISNLYSMDIQTAFEQIRFFEQVNELLSEAQISSIFTAFQNYPLDPEPEIQPSRSGPRVVKVQ